MLRIQKCLVLVTANVVLLSTAIGCAPGADSPSGESEAVDLHASVDSRAWSPPMAWTTWQIDFNIVNPWVSGWSNCYQRPLNQLVHSGEDWANAAGTAVNAIGPGWVVYAAWANYPGYVVVVRHDLTSSEQASLGVATSTIYSMYGHLGWLFVATGQPLATGQFIGTVLDQGSNSHLHWEVRTTDRPPLCAFNYPGPGYTNSGTNATSYGYLDPSTSVSRLSSAPASTCDNGVPLGGTACGQNGQTYQYVCVNPGAPSDQQWQIQACAAGQVCMGSGCTAGWNCADSSWGSAQVWTCGADGDRHECSGGSPIVDGCGLRCLVRSPGQDDLCVESDPAWSCAWSAYGAGQYWTCSGGLIHRCEQGVGVRVLCPAGCATMPLGQDDYCY